MRRRIWIAALASVGLHLLTGVLVVGSSLWRGWRLPPIEVDITGMRLEDLHDLPLGTPAATAPPSNDIVVPPPRSPARRPAANPDRGGSEQAEQRKQRSAGAPAPDAGTAPPRPSTVRSYAPAGSRVTALLRIDRLRGTPYMAAVDALLVHLPDRRDLLEGTGLDLYRDLDAILIATPNPVDPAVTFLAARHRLSDGALRAALDRGARATGRKLSWRIEHGRPFAERRSGGTTEAGGSRDSRLILLAAPHLVVVTPPAYRTLILRGGGVARAQARPADAGVADAGEQSAGTPARAQPATDGDDGGWAALLNRIDAEDSVLPPEAVAMLSIVDLFSARNVARAAGAVAGTRGSVDDTPAPAANALGLPLPRLLTATLGVSPQPFADVVGELAEESDAVRVENEWPGLRHKLLTNPWVVLGGFSPLVGRATLTREGSSIRLHIDATETETIRILLLLGGQLSALGR